MKLLRRVLLLAGLVALVASASAGAAPLTLDDLMKSLATMRSGRASFVEERRIVPIDQNPMNPPPQILRSSGELSFEAPDHFERRTLKPRDERLLVEGNTLTMSRGSRSRTLQLDSMPEAEAMVEAVRGTLTGNATVLQRYFDTQVEGTLADWKLQLLPKDARLRGTVKSIALRGRQSVLREVALQLADGDSSLMTIEPLTTEPAPKQ